MRRIFITVPLLASIIIVAGCAKIRTREGLVESEFRSYIKENTYDADCLIGIKCVTTIDTLKTSELKKHIKFATELMDSVITLVNKRRELIEDVLEKYGYAKNLYALIPNSKGALEYYEALFHEDSYYFHTVATKILGLKYDSIAPSRLCSVEAQRYEYVNDDIVYESQILARMKDGSSERIDTFYCYTDENCNSFDFTGQNNSVMLLLHNGNIVLETMNELIGKGEKQIQAADVFLRIIDDFEAKRNNYAQAY